MNLQIRWTSVALQSLTEVLEYTYSNFGKVQLLRLKNQINCAVNRVATFPNSGKIEQEIFDVTGIEYRSIVVIREIKLLYTVSDDFLFVEFVKNTRIDDYTMLAKINEQI